MILTYFLKLILGWRVWHFIFPKVKQTQAIADGELGRITPRPGSPLFFPNRQLLIIRFFSNKLKGPTAPAEYMDFDYWAKLCTFPILTVHVQ